MAQPETSALATDGLPARQTGPWVHEKKFYLERYLSIFTRGVDPKWNGKLSLVIFLIWIYYSAQILLFGAELTHVYALRYGSRMQTNHSQRLEIPDARK
jgi:hypothetical protein